ncbi:MAG TPA: DNA polymerase domain-containing protein [Candidatus Acidoferrum sp.]
MKLLQGWILDIYPNQRGMTLWLIDRNQSHYRLTDSFAPAFYVSGPEDRLLQLQDAAHRKTTELRTRFTERTDLWLNAARQVLEVSVLRPSNFIGWGRWVHKLDSKLQLYNSDLMVASLYCWEKRLFPLSYVEVEADDEGRVLSIACRDDEWALEYEMPPLKIMQLRLSGLSRVDPTHGRCAALEIEMDGTCWELDETGEPPALQFARLLKRHDPDVILSEWGDSTILPLLRQQAERLKSSLPLNRDESAAVQQSRGRSYTSYGRILFKASSITLFGRIHIDKQNSFISEKCDFAGLWELARITKLPIQYAARTTTGTGISYMQMELAHRDGVLIPEQKAEPEDPKRPDELLVADRGGLVFVPKLGFTPNVAELDFVSQFPSIMARFNISPETVNCPCCPDAPRIPELGYRVCQKRRGITSRVVERLIAKRCELKKLLKKSPPDTALRFKLQRDSMKWLLVCCFGYTGYKNARFGKIEAHEAINAVARETLLVAKEIAEAHGFELIHAIVDSLYVWKESATREDYERLSQEIENRTRLPLAIESVYRYVVFLPSKQYADVPVPNRFFAVGEDGELKVRGLECRRHDTPPLLGRMQHEVLTILAEAHDYESYLQKLEIARGVFANYEDRLANGEVDIRELVISKRITREPRDYQKAGVTAIAAQQLFGSGVKLRPGQNIEYVITNAEAHVPNDRVRAYALWEGWFGYDRKKYAAMLHEAFEPFVLCIPKRAEAVLLCESISEDDLKRFPLFSALAVSRS